MKNIFSQRNIIILLIVLLVSTIGLTAFFGYNEYMYRKIGVCFSEGNLKLAENYIETISPTYKDIAKIKTLILTVNNHEDDKKPDAERTLNRLKELKGFKNENINQYYNIYYFNIYKGIITNQAKAYISSVKSTTTTAPYISPETEPNDESYYSDNTTDDFTEMTTPSSDSSIVYYVENSEVYHISAECSSLARATNVLSGAVPEGRRACKICSE